MLPSAAWPRVSCVDLLTCVASCFVLPCPTLYTFPEHRSRTSRGASAGVHPVRRAGATGPSAEEPPLVGCHRVGHRALVIRVTCVPGIGGRARYPAPHTRHGHRQSHGLVASQPCTLLASNTSSLLAANDANRAMVTSPDADVNGVLGALHRRNHSAAEASSGLRECEQYENVTGNGETIAARTAWVIASRLVEPCSIIRYVVAPVPTREEMCHEVRHQLAPHHRHTGSIPEPIRYHSHGTSQ